MDSISLLSKRGKYKQLWTTLGEVRFRKYEFSLLGHSFQLGIWAGNARDRDFSHYFGSDFFQTLDQPNFFPRKSCPKILKFYVSLDVKLLQLNFQLMRTTPTMRT